MKVKVGNQKAARYMMGDDECKKCVFYSKSLRLCLFMNCDTYGVFIKLKLQKIFLSYETL